jgi:predicted ribosome quality control (RQC) complex YloA/Tae2 family protein
MERKRALTSVDIAALVTELGRYGGAKLDKAYLYPNDLLRLKMRDFDRGRVELLAEVRDRKRVHIADPERVSDAPGRPPNFAMMLRNRLSGADFAGVEQFEFDRILSLRFERDDANTTVVVELFGDGNVAVLNEDREVISCLDTIRLKSRTVAPGSQYGFPASRFDPLTADRGAFGQAMDNSDTDVVRTIATQLNFGGLWGEEICTRAGVEKTTAIEDATEGDYDNLFRVIDDLVTKLKEGNLNPRLYRDEDGGVVDATPVPMEEYEHLRSEPCTDFNAALDQYFHERRTADEGESGGEEYSDRPDFEEEIARKERIIAQQEGAIENFEEQAQAEREKAELLYANYDLVDEVLSTVRQARADDVPWDDIAAKFEEGKARGITAAEAVVDVDGSEGRVTLELDGTRVRLDPREGVEVNADRLYKEAKRVAEKKEGALAAIEDTREELAEIKSRKEAWEQRDEDHDESEGGDAEDEDVDWLGRRSVPVRRDEQWYERFRWFHTSDGFLVIGGRNADQNEELVKKYMDRGDRFFHTQAHGAPATVLKATGPSEAARDVEFPESSLKEAAQFAVSYSTVWKDGQFTGDVYMVEPSQVSKTPESGEYVEKGSFVVRGDRTYYRDTPVGVAVGIQVEPLSRVVGGPPSAIKGQAESVIRLEPGRYAQNDIAKMCYREFRKRFTDQTFVRKVASPDRIQEFCPAGGSRIVD